MRNLADKAYELSLKCNLKEEARLIQVEERKLANFQKDLNSNSMATNSPSLRDQNAAKTQDSAALQGKKADAKMKITTNMQKPQAVHPRWQGQAGGAKSTRSQKQQSKRKTQGFGASGIPSDHEIMRTINGDVTTAEGSKFFDDPDIDGEGEVVSSDEEPQINYS